MKKKIKKLKAKRNKIKYKSLILAFLIVLIVAFLGNLFTGTTTKSQWYESIKPSITPPNFVFPIAWTILFILIAIALYFSLAKDRKNKPVFYFFAINFITNILWSLFFFALKQPIIAFIDIIILWTSILAIILSSWKTNKITSLLLLPYLAWVSFALILNLLMIL